MSGVDAFRRKQLHDLWQKDWDEAKEAMKLLPWVPVAGLVLLSLSWALPGTGGKWTGYLAYAIIAGSLVVAAALGIRFWDIYWHLKDTEAEQPAVSDAWSSPDAPLADLLDGPGPVVPFERDETEIAHHSPPR